MGLKADRKVSKENNEKKTSTSDATPQIEKKKKAKEGLKPIPKATQTALKTKGLTPKRDPKKRADRIAEMRAQRMAFLKERRKKMIETKKRQKNKKTFKTA